ncbi:hypothetical protein MA16_Dca021418 [Dendrobium catenatum]|uniref:Uncharacterized protein n=1 Tax=Dendrobium catenatum TaxID=906689 RepID=A0A2I0WJ07_9ASPA|nr:hypothetical protein MA16_Dca021418 [Dendrobium catenatum]
MARKSWSAYTTWHFWLEQRLVMAVGSTLGSIWLSLGILGKSVVDSIWAGICKFGGQ